MPVRPTQVGQSSNEGPEKPNKDDDNTELDDDFNLELALEEILDADNDSTAKHETSREVFHQPSARPIIRTYITDSEEVKLRKWEDYHREVREIAARDKKRHSTQTPHALLQAPQGHEGRASFRPRKTYADEEPSFHENCCKNKGEGPRRESEPNAPKKKRMLQITPSRSKEPAEAAREKAWKEDEGENIKTLKESKGQSIQETTLQEHHNAPTEQGVTEGRHYPTKNAKKKRLPKKDMESCKKSTKRLPDTAKEGEAVSYACNTSNSPPQPAHRRGSWLPGTSGDLEDLSWGVPHPIREPRCGDELSSTIRLYRSNDSYNPKKSRS